MARPKSRYRETKTRRLYYVIPVIAILIVATGFVVAYILPPPSDVVLSFDVALEIQVAANSTSSRLVAPPQVGVPGGTWVVHTFDLYGAGGRYPIYTDTTPNGASFSVIHVRSRVVANYTLGDFFDVWGQPLGPSQTLTLPANSNYVWQMCVGSVGNPPSSSGNPNFGPELLTPNKFIVLIYYQVGGNGCL